MLSDNKDNNNNMNNMTHVNLETVKETVLDVARYDLYQLGHAIQSGNGLRALKILEGLEAEKEAFPLIIWQVSETARSIAKGEGSLRGVNTAMLTYLFQQLALMDAQFKGIKEGDPWASLRACIVMMTMA
jgi:DNA polymerase-3 subunit delta